MFQNLMIQIYVVEEKKWISTKKDIWEEIFACTLVFKQFLKICKIFW